MLYDILKVNIIKHFTSIHFTNYESNYESFYSYFEVYKHNCYNIC